MNEDDKMMNEISIKSLIDRWDPIGLLAMYAPLNEYASESKKIYNSVKGKENVSSLELGLIIYKIFNKSFGEDVFLKTTNECNEVAKKIIDANK